MSLFSFWMFITCTHEEIILIVSKLVITMQCFLVCMSVAYRANMHPAHTEDVTLNYEFHVNASLADVPCSTWPVILISLAFANCQRRR